MNIRKSLVFSMLSLMSLQTFGGFLGFTDPSKTCASVALGGTGLGFGSTAVKAAWGSVVLTGSRIGSQLVLAYRDNPAILIERNYNCPICLEDRNRGWNLGCSRAVDNPHMVCEVCLQQMMNHNNVRCPMCRQQVVQARAQEGIVSSLNNLIQKVGTIGCSAYAGFMGALSLNFMRYGQNFFDMSRGREGRFSSDSFSLMSGAGYGLAAGTGLCLVESLFPKVGDNQAHSGLSSKTWIRRPVVSAALGALAATTVIAARSGLSLASLAGSKNGLLKATGVGLACGVALEGACAWFRRR